MARKDLQVLMVPMASKVRKVPKARLAPKEKKDLRVHVVSAAFKALKGPSDLKAPKAVMVWMA